MTVRTSKCTPGLGWVTALGFVASMVAAGCADGSAGTPQPDAGADGSSPDGSISTESYDLVVVGAGSGGIGAAIQAARMGAQVALVEETDWVGGQMTAAGVTSMDGGRFLPAGTGIYAEFRERIRAYYEDPIRFPPTGKSVSTCYGGIDSVCFEPRVGRAILEEMLAETSVTLFLRTKVVSVRTEGNAVVEVDTDQNLRFELRVLVDATEHGDVIPQTPARYRVGNSMSAAIDPQACIQDLTYLAVIRKYASGVPPELVIEDPPPGYSNLEPVFNSIVTLDGSGDQSTWPINYPVSWPRHNAYRGMPDSTNPDSYTAQDRDMITRTGVNWANDFPGYMVVYVDGLPVGQWRDTLKIDYLEDPAYRRAVDCEAKLVTINFVYYIQHALGQTNWSVANDEGYDTAYNLEDNDCPGIPDALKPIEALMPVMPYVRESRRIVAVHTLTAKEMMREGTPAVAVTNFPSSIAVGDYPNDLHNCRSDEDLESDLGEVAADSSGGGPFQVPLETLIPETLDGFLAAEKNIGVSRLASGAIRLQPITMVTGQAAGALGALAVLYDIQPREVRGVDVQQELLAAGSALSRFHFEDVPLDNPYWAAVQLTNVHEIMAGYSHDQFGVSDPLTRVQAAVVLGRLFDLDVSNPPAAPTFTDVTPITHPWGYAYVEALYAAGYTVGCAAAPLRFCPDDPTTRAQMAAFVTRGLGLDPAQAPTTPFFDDVGPGNNFFEFVQLMADEGIMAGCTTTAFCPADPITRGGTAAAVYEVLVR